VVNPFGLTPGLTACSHKLCREFIVTVRCPPPVVSHRSHPYYIVPYAEVIPPLWYLIAPLPCCIVPYALWYLIASLSYYIVPYAEDAPPCGISSLPSPAVLCHTQREFPPVMSHRFPPPLYCSIRRGHAPPQWYLMASLPCYVVPYAQWYLIASLPSCIAQCLGSSGMVKCPPFGISSLPSPAVLSSALGALAWRSAPAAARSLSARTWSRCPASDSRSTWSSIGALRQRWRYIYIYICRAISNYRSIDRSIHLE